MGYYSGTIQKGSSGDDVKKWQQFLNSQGYNLTVDGIFGDNTYSATTEWQGKNGLGVDGIVGQNTWGKAGFSNINTPTSSPTTGNAPTKPNLTYNPFNSTTEGAKLHGNMNNAYNAFTGYGDPNWDKQGQADKLLDSILNRKDFSYDFNADAIYQQYKDTYIQQGKLAMADAMGQAAALTGGYGNSYSAAVGNQAYQAHLNNLNDIIPDLYQMAYNRYNQEGQDLYNQYGLLMQDYDRYMNDYTIGYGKVKDAYDAASGAYYNSADLYGKEQDTTNGLLQKAYENEFNAWVENNSNAWKQAEWDEAMRRYEKESAVNSVGGSSSGGSSSSTSSGGSSSGGTSGGGSEVGTGNTAMSSIRKKLDGFTSNTEVESYLERQEAAGVISHEDALKLMAEYMDDNEVYVDTDGGGKAVSYKGMVGSSKGWSVVSDGGVNWFWGVDNNARIKAPNGETYRLDDLIDKLVSEGMKKSDAKAAVKKLQKKLGI